MISHEMNVKPILYVSASLNVLLNQRIVENSLEVLQSHDEVGLGEISEFEAL